MHTMLRVRCALHAIESRSPSEKRGKTTTHGASRPTRKTDRFPAAVRHDHPEDRVRLFASGSGDGGVALETVRERRTDEAITDKDEILAAIAGLKTHIDESVNALAGITKAGFERVEADITAIKTNVGQLKTDVGQLKTDVGELKTAVDRVETKLGRHETRIENVDTRVKALEARP